MLALSREEPVHPKPDTFFEGKDTGTLVSKVLPSCEGGLHGHRYSCLKDLAYYKGRL